MRTISLIVFILFSISACKKEKELIEVDLPEPNQKDEVVYPNPNEVNTSDGPFKMKGLKYQYNDLEPFIDAKTMELHYSKHHLGYANKLNEAIKETEFKASNVEEILKNLESENQILRNNAGAYYNHNLFFETLTKEKKTKPSHIFLAAIETQFGSLDALKNEISNQANHLVGSGWVWIVLDSNKQLQVITTQNHDNPLLTDATVKGIPIFVIDLWEHAYYLKYNNSKKNYLENILNIIDWGMVSKRYENQLTLE